MTVEQYLANVNDIYKTGISTEHSFRGILQNLIENLLPDYRATNEPKRQLCGAPDYIVTKNDIPVGYIEAKDIGDGDLEGEKKTGNKEQFDRYKLSLGNIIFTDYLTFHLYRNGQLVLKVTIGEIKKSKVAPLPNFFDDFEKLISEFSTYVSQPIKNSKRLAELMAAKARLLADVIEQALQSDETHNEDSSLKEQLSAFQLILIHDITAKGFADVYSQTIAYGMFAARLHDSTINTFSRQEAAELIPRSNPFLRRLFGYIAGPDIDDRIRWIVDSLVEVFLACNVSEIMQDYGKSTKMEDPIIHFYETFLSEYDPNLRKSRGVWYTPKPVVNFIIRAVNDILKTDFDLPMGLADNSKTTIKVNIQKTDKRYKDNVKTIEEEVHRVQILDPATGTGTFLADIIKHIYKEFEGQRGIWDNYVQMHLIPRLNGFELLMASYAMAHLQMDLVLSETGFISTSSQRFKIYLTNSLEEFHQDTGTLWANWLSSEANEANHIKRDAPVMCVIGNPPYNGESPNKGEWIMDLMEDYKKEPGGKEKLKERNPKWINNDYVKFIRYGQHFIEKNGSGILAFINPHSFLDNPTFRGMRWNLLKTFDKIYSLDLHGDSTKKETTPDGNSDQNVFDIKQGVSINIFIKTGQKKDNDLGKVYKYDLYGSRELKYNFLNENDLLSIPFEEIQNESPMYYMVKNDFALVDEYNSGFSINDLFLEQSMGITTGDDDNYISFYKNDIFKKYSKTYLKTIDYRPFDKRYINYDQKVLARARYNFMSNFLDDNFGLCLVRRSRSNKFLLPLVTKDIVDKCILSTLDNANIFPLYRYKASKEQVSIYDGNNRIPNLDMEIVNHIEHGLSIKFFPEKDVTREGFSPVDLLDYIIGILYDPSYTYRFDNYLKLDFPRIPIPNNKSDFWKCVKIGEKIRKVQMLDSTVLGKTTSNYPIQGSNIVEKIMFDNTKVYINSNQFFDNVSQEAFDFTIGGYQPAQKWLKDRKGEELEYEDILHYEKIIAALTELKEIVNKF